MREFFLSWGLVFLSALFDSYAAFIVKTQFNKLGKIDFSSFANVLDYMITFFKNPVLLTAIATFVAAPGLWFVALNRLDLSIAYPVLVGFHLIFVLFLGIAFLGEGLNLNKTIGCGLVLLSLYFFYKN
jgi:multidrug transporter EmrE-like cation transporter